MQTVWQWVLGAFASLYELIVCAVKRGMCNLAEEVLRLMSDWVLPMLDYLPEAPNWDLTQVGAYLKTASYWLPLPEMIAMITAYGTFKVAFLVVRTIKRFIPTVA